MNTNVALTFTPSPSAPALPDALTSRRGKHARMQKRVPEVRVIACEHAHASRIPRHARAMQFAYQPLESNQSARESLYQSLRGVEFALSFRERRMAAIAGTVLAAVSLAAVLW